MQNSYLCLNHFTYISFTVEQQVPKSASNPLNKYFPSVVWSHGDIVSIQNIIFTVIPEGHVAHIQRVALIFNCILHFKVRRKEMQINVFLPDMMQHNLFCFVAFSLQRGD